MLKPRPDSEDQRFLNGSCEFGPTPPPPSRGLTGLISILIPEIRDFKISEHENCQLYAPLTNIIMAQVEKTHISGRN